MAFYFDLAAQYRKKIESGELISGERLPIEGELAEQHGVSIATISRCVQLLKSDGLLYTTHAGTFVGKRPPDPRLRGHLPLIHCVNQPWCNNMAEMKTTQVNIGALLVQAGWIWRGSTQGRIYYCHQCAPGVLEREGKKGTT